MFLIDIVEFFKKPIGLSILFNVLLGLTVLGLVISFKVVGIILLILLGLLILSIPTLASIFIFKMYKALRDSYEKMFAFFLSIEQELKKVDEMEITNLEIVELKQKIKTVREFMKIEQARRKQNG